MINVINCDSLILLAESLQSDFSSGGICFTVNTETPIISHYFTVKVRQDNVKDSISTSFERNEMLYCMIKERERFGFGLVLELFPYAESSVH